MKKVTGYMGVVLYFQCILCQVSAQSSAPITPCAIRWDAWYTNGPGEPGYYTAAALSPLEWHDRAPLHAKFDASGKITWAASQETFDAEIRSAHSANLCWAYLMYGKDNTIDLDNPMMRGLVFHRASSIKSEVKYALMTTTGLLGTTANHQEAVNATLRLMHDSNYQYVTIDAVKRPVLFLYYGETDLDRSFGGSLEKMREVIDSIRARSIEQALGNPYVTVVYGPAEQAEAIRIGLGADALTEYISGTRKKGVESWAEFEPSIEKDWSRYAAASSGGALPTLRTGADIRARCQNPPPYEHRFPVGSKCDTYTINPTLTEWAAEFHNAVSWIRSHPKNDPSGLLLIYAWSECDESGNCLMPTIADPKGEKLKVISKFE